MANDSPAEILRAMAERIDRNNPAEFGGCLVVIPPDSDEHYPGETLEILVVDPARSLANFWDVVGKRSQNAAAEWAARNQTPHPGSYR